MQIDGAITPLEPQEFTYDLPLGFGPLQRGAVVKITAIPATYSNTEYRSQIERIMHEARVRDLKRERLHERRTNFDRMATDQRRDLERALEDMVGALHDCCIVSWSTTIQSNGRDLEATRENFIELARFEHPEMELLFKKIQSDLNEYSRIEATAQEEAEEEETKK